jgi:hypothetical protein
MELIVQHYFGPTLELPAPVLPGSRTAPLIKLTVQL